MKKNYQTPAIVAVKMEVVALQVGTVTSNASIKMGGGGSGPARGRDGGSWEDED